MLYRIGGIAILGLSIVLSLTGCDIEYETADMQIDSVGVLYISEDRPAKVLIGAVESWSSNDTCGKIDATVYAEQEGGTIKLSATKEVLAGNTFCDKAEVDTYGEVYVENLEVGDYKIVADGRELLQFRIEADAGYVIRRPVIKTIGISVETAEGVRSIGFPKDSVDPVQVTLNICGYFGTECEPLLKTHIEQDEQGNFNVDISGEVPINADCLLIIKSDWYHLNDPYQAQIDLGEVSPGNYLVSVNGEDASLSDEK